MRTTTAVAGRMKTRKKTTIAIALIAVLAVVGALVHRQAFAKETAAYRFTAVERGDVEASVSATGTLGAVRTVQVGTQVSGQVSELLVDFNDRVKKGQLLARIDPTLQQQAVTDAYAALERAQAQALQASREHNRNAQLASAGLVARSEVEMTDSSLDVARANVKSAQVALERAKRNLEYTNIYAPIDGVVVERNVDLGQTVAASLSAPQLFLIANDLTRMQILAKVGEGDIAGIKQGQKVKFSVQALPRDTFEGTVGQVRLQSATTENVVSYTVVVNVANEEKKLLPGMTARVKFVTRSAEDVLKVANAALRFKPELSVIPSREDGEGSPAASRGPRSRGASGTLYVVDATGKLQSINVRAGVTDGSFTEIRGQGVKEGMQFVAGTAQPAQAESQSSNPFQGQQQPPRGARGGF
jgi:HlyD family secretion protein